MLNKTHRAFITAAWLLVSPWSLNIAIAQEQNKNDQTTSIESIKQSNISSDFKLPVTLNSKNQSLDGKAKTSIFTNNVVIRQGSLEILADRLELDATAGKGKEILIANGQPASYSQRLEDGSLVKASANEIIYKVEFQTISLVGNAAITQNEVKMNGNTIAFDMAKERIMASVDENSNDVVTTVLSPGVFDSEPDEPKQ